MWVGGLARIPSHHRATTVPVRRKPQMTAERGRKIQRQPSAVKALRRTFSRIGKRIIVQFEYQLLIIYVVVAVREAFQCASVFPLMPGLFFLSAYLFLASFFSSPFLFFSPLFRSEYISHSHF